MSQLDQLAATLAAYIAADPALQAHDGLPAIEPLLEKKGDLNTTIKTALEKLGLAVVVIVAECSPKESGRLHHVCSARLIVEVSETVPLNKTGRTCAAVAERVWAAVDGQLTHAVDGRLPLRPCFEIEPGSNLRLIPHATQTIRHISFTAEVSL